MNFSWWAANLLTCSFFQSIIVVAFWSGNSFYLGNQLTISTASAISWRAIRIAAVRELGLCRDSCSPATHSGYSKSKNGRAPYLDRLMARAEANAGRGATERRGAVWYAMWEQRCVNPQ